MGGLVASGTMSMGIGTSSAERFREYAAHCIHQATGAPSPEDKYLFLNMALAWVRLAHQSQAITAMIDGARTDGMLPVDGAPDIAPS